jgi:hypothetical protein
VPAPTSRITPRATSWRERSLAIIAFLCAAFGALLWWGLVFGPARVDAKGIVLTGTREQTFIALLAVATVAAFCGAWWAWRGARATRAALLPIAPVLAVSAALIERSLPGEGRPIAFYAACALMPALLVWVATRRARSIG